jgi:hypothetical protein
MRGWATGTAAVAMLALLAGCGGQSPVDQFDDAALAAEQAGRSAAWSLAALDMSEYCLRQLQDGLGNPAASERGIDQMIAIARRFPDEDDTGATYRQKLGDQASAMQGCAPDLALKLDRALATLD